MNKAKVTKILQLLKQANPNAATELNYSTPFELLIAVILSAHTTDVSVNKATAKLFPIANTPQKILQLGTTKLKNYLKGLGLYNAKTANVLKTCQILVEQHNSSVPHSRTALEALPGVGRKTANVILNIIFKEPTIAVDTHIFRVSNRTKMATGTNPLIVEKKLLAVVPKQLVHDAHHLLLLHGRYTCTAKKPKCHECIINKLCEYQDKNI